MNNTLEKDGKLFKEFYAWMPDSKPETTRAVAYVSECGEVVIGEYISWNSRNNSHQVRKMKTLKQSFRGKYLRVTVNNKSVSVHRCVATAWVSGQFDGAEVNHKNGNKECNHAANLEWVSRSQNQKHISDVLKKRCCENHANSKYTRQTILEIKKMLSQGVRNSDICRELGVNKYIVSDVKRGKAWRNV